jgi:hypothetical protein
MYEEDEEEQKEGDKEMKKKKYAHQENLKEEAKDVVVRFINV